MAFQGDAIFWVDTDKVVPNPFQPRREFDQSKLQELSESIRMYGVLQPLTVTRNEVQRDDGTFYTEYELIAGERRLRASRLASIAQVPVIIREGEQSEQEKLELAIIENLQREDLNAIDRAIAFQQLAEQFGLSHSQVATKVQRSREYVSNSIRLLGLPEHMQASLQRGELGEGHARTLLMLTDRPEEQEVIFREILLKKMSVREVERIVRKIATDKVRKKNHADIGDHLIEIEKEFTETLGTRVQIQKTEFGGKLTIDYFSEDDLAMLLKRMQVEAQGDFSQPQALVDALETVVAATPLAQASPVQEFTSTPVAQQPQPEVSQPTTGNTYAHTEPVARPDPVVLPPAQVTPTPVPAAQPPISPVTTPPEAPAPTTDHNHGLIGRLAAHAPFGFSRPTPPVVEAATPAQPTVSAAPAENPESAPTTTEPAYAQQTQPVTPVPTPAVPEQLAKKSDDELDLYSVRNFSV